MFCPIPTASPAQASVIFVIKYFSQGKRFTEIVTFKKYIPFIGVLTEPALSLDALICGLQFPLDKPLDFAFYFLL